MWEVRVSKVDSRAEIDDINFNVFGNVESCSATKSSTHNFSLKTTTFNYSNEISPWNEAP